MASPAITTTLKYTLTFHHSAKFSSLSSQPPLMPEGAALRAIQKAFREKEPLPISMEGKETIMIINLLECTAITSLSPDDVPSATEEPIKIEFQDACPGITIYVAKDKLPSYRTAIIAGIAARTIVTIQNTRLQTVLFDASKVLAVVC